MNLVDPSTIREHYSKKPSRVVLDVLPDEIFEKRHIKDAVNACVYEIDFIEKGTTLEKDQSREIVFYGQNDQFEAALLAFEKLQSNGLTHVTVLRSGIENWESLGYPIRGDGFQPDLLSGVFKASIEKTPYAGQAETCLISTMASFFSRKRPSSSKMTNSLEERQ